jgi:hypothetical protein
MKCKAVGLADVGVSMHARHALTHHSFATSDAERQISERCKRIVLSFSEMATSPARHHCWRLAAFILIQSALWITTACAQFATGTVRDCGLFATWSDDCATPPSLIKPYAIFSLTSGGNVELRNDFGPSYDEMVYRIVDAQRLSHLRLPLRQLLTTDHPIALNTIVMKANDRIRVRSARASDGSIFVRAEPSPRRTVEKRDG